MISRLAMERTSDIRATHIRNLPDQLFALLFKDSARGSRFATWR